ncbi:flavin reductase family protein [Gordonia sp. CPCC 205333]|uniref:flavin reductase family protein n=1 Tax=Gordonia sp. CPCC 205333 TaxID=3140790 RepID=UPI003AF3328F
MRNYDPADPEVHMHSLLNAVVLPRPIAWVGSRTVDGVDNVAPHSYFTISSLNPPIVQFTSIGTKDTLRNVRQTREFTVSLANRELMAQINISSAPVPPQVSEFDITGLTRRSSVKVDAPSVAESPVSIECQLFDTMEFAGGDVVVFGEVVWVRVDEDCLIDGYPDVELLAPLSRLGGPFWGDVGTISTMTRPTAEEAMHTGGT